MPGQHYSYIFLEALAFSVVFLILFSLGLSRTLITVRYIVVNLFLCAGWLTLDHIALRSGVFSYPPNGGNLPLRIAGLPIEEYFFFPMVISAVWTLILIARPPGHVGPRQGL